jgi:hypothetical protein
MRQLDYARSFAKARKLATIDRSPAPAWPLISVVCICLFIGAMGKSAQFPLHVWLPDSMEGPTPISALIHAATMVTAGIFMVSRMSPLFELSRRGAVLRHRHRRHHRLLHGADRHRPDRHQARRGLLDAVAARLHDHRAGRLGLLGGDVPPATHAFFKAVLFLGAGSVIIAMHHEQDMRKMGGLRKYMPITYLTVLIGAIANAGLPPFAGFFSKDSIIEAVHLRPRRAPASPTLLILAGVFVGGFYSFRLVFFAFHGEGALPPRGASAKLAHAAMLLMMRTRRTRRMMRRPRRAHGRRPWPPWPGGAEGVALGGDRAADPAGDPGHRLGLADRAGALRQLLRRRDLHRPEHPAIATMAQGVPRHASA